MSIALNIRVLVDPSLVESPAERAALMDRLSDFTAVLEEDGGVGDIIDDALAENFYTQGYGAWAPLSAGTVAERFREGYGPNQPLFRTGAAFDALTDRDSPDHKFLVSKFGIVTGAYTDRLTYISALADGSPARHLPARILIQVQPEFVQEVVRKIADWLGGGSAVTVFADAPIEV